MRRSLSLLALTAFAGPVCLVAFACGSDDSPGGGTNADTGAIDAGTGLCGQAACHTGELCCAGPDEACTPTCTAATKCPVYGRPCRLPDAGTDAAPALAWYRTCGDPICRDPGDAGDAAAPDAAACPAEGSACTEKGATCGDGATTCGSVLVCDDHDPKTGGCPVSSAKYKSGITYVGDDDLQRLHDETLATRLATYAYKTPLGDPGVTHLGFVVEDQPTSYAVDRGHDRVDLYGYVSMLVATTQVQEKEIAALRAEVERLRETTSRKAP